MENNGHQEILEAISGLAQHMDERFNEFQFSVDERFGQVDKRFEELEERFDKKLAAQTHELKSYIDDKLADYTSDIFKRLEKREQLDRKFKEKVVEIFRRSNLAAGEDLAFLEGLLEG